MDSVLIEEEQISLLGKMLYYSAKHLTTREREMYDQLVEQLLKKVNQLRTVERRNAAQNAGSPSDMQNLAKRDALLNVPPEEICRMFVDSWNKQDFETEFFCLSGNFPAHKKKTDNIREYVLHRMKKYQDRHTVGPKLKRIVEISSSETHGNKTSVYCIELHKMPDKDLVLHRQYDLIHENGGWRISDFETLKSHETPSTPNTSATSA